MKKTASILIVLFCCLFAMTTQAEIKTFVHTVRQPFSGSQSPDDARVAAIYKAKREVLEKAGTYLETLTVLEEGNLTKDQVLALASGVLKTEIISQKPYTTGEGYGVIVKVRVKVDTGQVEQKLKRLVNDKPAIKELVELSKRDKELLDRIERLEEMSQRLAKEKETQTVKKKKRELKKDFKQATKGLNATSLYNQALDLAKDRNHHNLRRAIKLLGKAIELDPGFAGIYNNRGIAYARLDQPIKAIQDYSKAIELDPGSAVAFYNRGIAYARLNQPIKAIQDYRNAIELDPDFAVAFYNRGIAYARLNQPIKAIRDYNKAIELDPGSACTYNNRGIAYARLNQPIKAIQDYNKAIELDPGSGDAYNNRGLEYMILQRVSQGCADLKKACSLGHCSGLKKYVKIGLCL